MKLRTMVWCGWFGLASLGGGCFGSGGGGSGGYKISSKVDADSIILETRVQPIGEEDGLDSLWTAASLSCQLTKARYEADEFELFEATCSDIPMRYGQPKGDTTILVHCPASAGEAACKKEFKKVLRTAKDARYIK
jgi:hypothetical protein